MKHILVTIDEDPQAEKVIALAGEIAQKLGAHVTVFHVMADEKYRRIEEEQLHDQVEHPFTITQAEEQARSFAAETAVPLRDMGVSFDVRGKVGDPPTEILALAQEIDADFIVMGFEGLHGLDRLRALGSVSRAVMEKTRRPALIVPALAE
ncbi:MAG: universal stress protein [Anaerolineae bacterium]